MIVNDYCRGLMTHGMTTYIGNTQDKKTLKRINKLINDVKRSPFEGIGKPEPL